VKDDFAVALLVLAAILACAVTGLLAWLMPT
jgi:hypothetical protein